VKVVVTGAAGFIGSHLVEALSRHERVTEVVAVDAFTDYYDVADKRRNTEAFQPRKVRLVEADLNDLDLLQLLDGVAHVYHQAGQPGVRASWGTEFARYVRQNVEATQRLLEAAKQLGTVESFVYASSSSVYGEAERYPTTEEDLPAPRSPYGVTKLAAEHLGRLYAANFGVPVVALRYFTVYGPRQRPDMAFRRFIHSALEDRPIEVYGDGTQIREFTHVSDIVRANLLAGFGAVAPGTVINLSGGASVSVNEVIDVLGQLLGRQIRASYGEPVPGDVFRTGGSTQRAHQLLGWSPEIDIDSGLETECKWLEQLLSAKQPGS
jgi:UDP-glucuronate 4-epimerase